MGEYHEKEHFIDGGGLLAVLFCILLITGCPQPQPQSQSTDKKKDNPAPSGLPLKIKDTANLAELRILTFNKGTKKGTFEHQMIASGSPVASGDFEIDVSSSPKKFIVTNEASSDGILLNINGLHPIDGSNKVIVSHHQYDLTPLLALLN